MPGPKQVVAYRPNQVWVADITYLPTRSGISYASLVTDAHSRKVVGHHVHEGLRSEDAEQALRKASHDRSGREPLIHPLTGVSSTAAPAARSCVASMVFTVR